MKRSDNVIQLAAVRKASDRALDARRRMDRAGELDDAAYNAASDDLVNASATTLAGAKAQFDYLHTMLDEGMTLEDDAVEKVMHSIGRLLSRLAARTAA